eukprot:SAG31_NODE_34105_length_336_cov_1.063291_1_plen_45_part_10
MRQQQRQRVGLMVYNPYRNPSSVWQLNLKTIGVMWLRQRVRDGTS